MTQGNEPRFPESGVGARLREAREAKGLDIAEVGQRLRMPIRVIESLEAEDWSRLGAPIFVRGQLRSYARLLGLPVGEVVQAPELAPVTVAELKPRTYTPPMQRFAEQTARRAVYIVLTVAILVPVWVATREQPAQDVVTEATPLEEPAPDGERNVATKQRPRAAMRASLAPLPSRPAAAALVLRFDGDSWVEIVDDDGKTLESGLVQAGQTRRYDAGELGRVKLGNAGAVRVLHEGEVQDLAPYQRANVARFTVSSDGSLAPPVD